jgi:hypothetical protein
MQMRVRVSELKFTVEVGEKGSAFSVTDSRAIARVEVESVIKTGDLFVAARVTLTLPKIVVIRAKLISVRRIPGEQRRRPIIIEIDSITGLCPNVDTKIGKL